MLTEKRGLDDRRRLMLAEHERRKAFLYLDAGFKMRTMCESYGRRAPDKYYAPPYVDEQADP